MDVRTKWGDFATVPPFHISDIEGPEEFRRSLGDGLIGVLTLTQVSNTRSLRESLAKMLRDMESDDQLFEPADAARKDLNSALRKSKRRKDTAVRDPGPSGHQARADLEVQYLKSMQQLQTKKR